MGTKRSPLYRFREGMGLDIELARPKNEPDAEDGDLGDGGSKLKQNGDVHDKEDGNVGTTMHVGGGLFKGKHKSGETTTHHKTMKDAAKAVLDIHKRKKAAESEAPPQDG